GQNFAHRIDARAALAQVDVGQHQAGPLGMGLGHGLVAGGGDGDDLVAQFGDQILQVQGDDGLVLDNQHLAGKLAVDGLLGAQNGGFDLFRALVQDEGGFFQAEGLDRGQQQGGALVGGQAAQARFGG